MNILVVSEAFCGGGLETHILNYYQALRSEHQFTFAFGTYSNQHTLDLDTIDSSFCFRWESTVEEFCDDVEHLVRIIKTHQIDVIHAHPFISVFPAMIASQLTHTPLVYTYHGIASFSFISRLNEAILYYYGLKELTSKIFAVSETGKNALKNEMRLENVCYLPNPVDTMQYYEHRVQNNRVWAAISRLDKDNGKEEALKKLFLMLPELDIERIDIYGDGTQKEALESFVAQHGLTEKVRFMGYQSDLYDLLNGCYNGVIGTDRVAIEGLVMGYPVLEMGYGRINGIIDRSLLNMAIDTNFNANILPEVCDVAELNDMLARVYRDPSAYSFRNEIFEKFDSSKIAAAYIHQLETLSFHNHANVCEFYQSICDLPCKEENFYRSTAVLALMRPHIEYYAVMPDVKNLFLLGSMMQSLKDQIHESKFKSILRRIYQKMVRVLKKILRM